MDLPIGSERSIPTHVVGIGASAGGLSALEAFFDRLPSDTNMAFVVVQHLSPHFKSLMDDLLAKHTTMPIHVASHGLEVEANTVYLIPPNTQMAMQDNRLHLSERTASPVDLPIDVFFTSLAQAVKSQSVAIILSGTGTDGSRGVRLVHQEGGLVLVQTPETAQFDGMPRSALATGVCDCMSPPGDMAALLADYVRDPASVRGRSLRPKIGEVPAAEFSRIFEQLQQAFEIDFSRYKMPTVSRRINRRMDFLQIDDIAEYAAFLTLNGDELHALYRDLLIGVTEFFRDPAHFERLANQIFPAMLGEIGPGEDLRIWSAGCATGEEAYSLAIIAAEAAEAAEFRGRISVFATDVHRASLEVAAAGSYEAERLTNVSPARLARFFRRDGDDRYRISPDLRKIVIFAPHNLAKDAPFTKLDLVCCRNLLIYFQPELQDRIISLFHFSLRQHGVLFLGPSESTGPHSCAFDVIDSGAKIFRKSCEKLLPVTLPDATAVRVPLPILSASPNSSRTTNIDRQLLHDYDSILGRQTPGVIIDENRQVLHYCGEIARFMAAPRGRPTKDLIDLAEGDLQIAIYTALPRAEKRGESVSIRNVRLKREAEELFVNIVVDPIWDPRSRTTHYHIYFSDVRPTVPLPLAPEGSVDFESESYYPQLLADLRNELRSTKENLQTAVEELQTSNEELQATNEELLASNEELQSTNEELHSVNEELYTVNSEFERKNGALAEINLDHEHLLSSIQVGIIFLDKNLRIRKFNEFVGSSFKLLPQDIGRPIDHIAYHLEDGRRVVEDVQQVLDSGVPLEHEVVTPEGAVLLKRLLPFRSEQGQVDGAVLTFTDVTSLKQAEREVSRMNASLERLVEERTQELRQQIAARVATEAALKVSLEKYKVLFAALQPLAFMLTDEKGQIREVNSYSTELFGADEAELLRRTVDSPQWRALSPHGEELHPSEFTPVKALRDRRPYTGHEVGIPSGNGQVRWLNLSAAPVPLENYGVAIAALDISERKAAADRLQASERRFRSLFESMHEGFALHEFIHDEQGSPMDYRFLEVNAAFADLLCMQPQDISGRTMRELFPSQPPRWLEHLCEAALTGKVCEFEERMEPQERYLQVTVFSPNENQFAAVVADITARRRYQDEQLRRQKLESLGVMAGGIAHDFNNLFTVIIGNLSLGLDEEGVPAELRKVLAETLEGCERASGLSRQLLTFAKGGEPIKKVLAPRKVLEESVSIVGCGRTVSWEWQVAGEPWAVEADPGQLSQVFNNILLNAVQAMPAGGTVRIDVENRDLPAGTELPLPPGRYVNITLSDEGCGIAPEHLDKIFDPFFTTKEVGTGLGLASVHSIVRHHGGHIAVNSVLNQGTSFSIHLPASSEALAVNEPLTRPPAPSMFEGSRVLVMEDQPAILRLLCRTISRFGPSAQGATTGTEAIEAFRAAMASGAPFDAVILDLTVPGGMGGDEVARELLKLDPKARLIVSSGYSTHPVMARYRESGFCAAIAKPYREQEVRRVLSDILRAGARRKS